MSITTYPLDGIDFSAKDVETYLSTRSSGVYHDSEDFAIAVTDDRKVTVSEGLAWMRVKRFSGKSVCVNEPVDLAIDAANGALPRIDRIVLRFDVALNASVLAVKKGAAASSPKAPDIQRDTLIYELGLYTVSVPAGSTTISESDITDTRGDADVCGQMTDVVSASISNPYPVGSIYLSVSDTSPASLFGGAWERIEDVFLLAAGSTFAAGNTGGEAEVILTLAQMPTHHHSAYAAPGGTDSFAAYGGVFDGNRTTAHEGWGGLTTRVGGDEAHNNMPPYLAVYVWKRVR